MQKNILSPILKWPGGKQDELHLILPNMPDDIDTYYEPFLGGGALYLTIPADIPAYVNDKSSDLIGLYQMVATQNDAFFALLDAIQAQWEAIEAILDDDPLVETYKVYRQGRDEAQLKGAIKRFIARNPGLLRLPLRGDVKAVRTFYANALEKSIFNKAGRMAKLEAESGLFSDGDIQDNIEAAVKAAFYYYLRYLYNYALDLAPAAAAAVFFFLRENAYAAMFRFNSKGHFNVPYGGISYNRKDIRSKLARLKNPDLIQRLSNTTFGNADFFAFMQQHPPTTHDFVFLDPPYDTQFNDYDQNTFGQADQRRLAHYLIAECKARFMLVIKNTPFITSLYADSGLTILEFDKKYMYTVKSRNKRDVTHLHITNY